MVVVLAQAKQGETEKRVSDLAAQLEALQHENEALHQQNLPLQAALVVRAAAPAPAPTPAPASAPDSPASTSGQVRGVASLTWCLEVYTCLPDRSCSDMPCCSAGQQRAWLGAVRRPARVCGAVYWLLQHAPVVVCLPRA